MIKNVFINKKYFFNVYKRVKLFFLATSRSACALSFSYLRVANALNLINSWFRCCTFLWSVAVFCLNVPSGCPRNLKRLFGKSPTQMNHSWVWLPVAHQPLPIHSRIPWQWPLAMFRPPQCRQTQKWPSHLGCPPRRPRPRISGKKDVTVVECIAEALPMTDRKFSFKSQES